MTERQVKLVIGSLLHDIGKVIYRQGDGRNHSVSGYDFLKEEAGIKDREILEAVHYHHGKWLQGGKLEEDSLAYIVYIADNIAAATDRRDGETEERGFEASVALESIFNLLNGNHQKYSYSPQTMEDKYGINYPEKESRKFDLSFYKEVKQKILENLRGAEWREEYINSMLELLEATLSYVPSSTNKAEVGDISLFDHVKLTAAIASCIQKDLESRAITDYRQELFLKAKEYYAKRVFLLYSMDMSGIQDFIYTISSKNALKVLRAKSFYLDLLMEHIVDELLEKLGLSRTNLIYSGGGHCYLLLPNTEECKKIVKEQENQVNHWMREEFQTALFLAGGWAEASAETLKNNPKGSYGQLYRTMSDSIAEKKMHRYGSKEILDLNSQKSTDYTRECKVCKRLDQLNEDALCKVCGALEELSKDILYQNFFAIMNGKKEGMLPLPGNKYLEGVSEKELRKRMADEDYVRSYGKNGFHAGRHIATKLWVADYTTGDTFQSFAQKAEGIKRIAVYRADVDNLGQAFVSGFLREGEDDHYVTLSRTASLSRHLSLFFKHYMKKILEEPQYGMQETPGPRNLAVVYSGGDDLFVVGAWNEVIEFSVDLQEAFRRYTQGTLTLSGGIGIYEPTYPIHIMAQEVQELEEKSKSLDGKNAVTLFEEAGAYPWKRFLDQVLGEKLKILQRAFGEGSAYGKSCLYHILKLIRSREEKIQFARYVYLLARMEPEKGADESQKEAYRNFSRSMYEWWKSKEDLECRELITAIYLYIYSIRDKEGV